MLYAVANCALASCVGFAIAFKHLLAPVRSLISKLKIKNIKWNYKQKK